MTYIDRKRLRDRGGIAMEPARRRFLFLAAAATALPCIPQVASALDYPTRPVRIIDGFAPGVSSDILARLVAQWLSERLGQQFVVENRPGASGNVGTEAVVRAPPDGYTLLLSVLTNSINATLYPNLHFNFARDIVPVAFIGITPYVMVVNPAFPAKTIPEFIAYAKANPGKINMASAGVGTASHVFGELFKMMTGSDLVHVPYRNSVMPDLLSGQVQVAFNPVPSQIEYMRAGKLRALAVTTATRLEVLPDVSTIGEFVPGYEASSWSGIGAPRMTSPEIIAKLNNEINAIGADPTMKARLVAFGVQSTSMTPAEFGKFIAAETEKWAKVIRFAGIKAD